ncbi:MAG: hypothetical protein BGN88_10040 [Clostridiales bacterium 43-6]|nr:MAG: hypothetical protein BGN88_10040 [Clostridiales bacterium 43-6]
MGNKKSFGCFMYALFSMIMLISVTIVSVLVANETLKSGWIYTIVIPILLWFCISAIISKKQQAKLPMIQSNAILVEKTQDNHRSGSTYFLTFDLEDGGRKTFKVELNQFAEVEKNEKGLLKYKQMNKKREHYLSYLFVEFEKEQ